MNIEREKASEGVRLRGFPEWAVTSTASRSSIGRLRFSLSETSRFLVPIPSGCFEFDVSSGSARGSARAASAIARSTSQAGWRLGGGRHRSNERPLGRCRIIGVVNIAELIQHWDGVEIPASGEWQIAPGQKLAAPERRYHGLRGLCLCTTSGMLAVSTNPCVVTLELELSSADACAARTVAYAGELTAADRYGRWQFCGTVATDGSWASPLNLAIIYQGVYRQGAVPVAWLTIAGPTSDDSPRWRRDRGSLMFHGDLNAQQAPTMEQLAALWGPREASAL